MLRTWNSRREWNPADDSKFRRCKDDRKIIATSNEFAKNKIKLMLYNNIVMPDVFVPMLIFLTWYIKEILTLAWCPSR
jgi:hypothetical protein